MRKMYMHLKKLVNNKLKDFTKTSLYSSFLWLYKNTDTHADTAEGRNHSAIWGV